jgi:nucleoside-diphosphate-sugar epimerase
LRKAVARDDPFVVWGSPEVGRDILYADDFGRAVVAMLEATHIKFDVFNIGSGRVTTVGEVAELALRAAGHKPAEIVYDSASPTTVAQRMLDCAKARDLLGWQPETTPAEGIGRTVAWWRANKDTWQR